MRNTRFFAPLKRGWKAAVVLCLLLLVPTGVPAGKPVKDAPAAGQKATQQNEKQAKKRPRRKRLSDQQRAAGVRALMKRLGVGPGSVVADIGAGNGRDSCTMAEVVGPQGSVFAEEIAKDKLKTIEKTAAERKLDQVHPVLGKVDDPCLPAEKLDLAYMHFVYHHVTKPREMLRAIWRALKPGGLFVVIDRRRGTLQDWVPRSARGKKHYWLAETTVVREAREEGFLFDGFAEDVWPEKDAFVLVFRRPEGVAAPGNDPDPFLPLDLEKLTEQLAPPAAKYRRPAFVALGEARKVIPAVLKHSRGAGIDIVLEEWATQKDERPPLPEGVEIPSVLTEKGDPHLTEPVDVVFFLDTYHLLFHYETLLARLREKLADGGRIYVLDRRGPAGLSHREASHRRKIAPQLVQQEMRKAGFVLEKQLSAPAADRFLLRFAPASGDH